jgi:hypothetical protein
MLEIVGFGSFVERNNSLQNVILNSAVAFTQGKLYAFPKSSLPPKTLVGQEVDFSKMAI